jgi:hypothetical protein
VLRGHCKIRESLYVIVYLGFMEKKTNRPVVEDGEEGLTAAEQFYSLAA